MTDTRFAEMLREMGLTIAEFSRQYQVPYRTAQNWKLGTVDCPAHVLVMLTKIREMEAVKVLPVDDAEVKSLKDKVKSLKAEIKSLKKAINRCLKCLREVTMIDAI